jgi:hypothetical protein
MIDERGSTVRYTKLIRSKRSRQSDSKRHKCLLRDMFTSMGKYLQISINIYKALILRTTVEIHQRARRGRIMRALGCFLLNSARSPSKPSERFCFDLRLLFWARRYLFTTHTSCFNSLRWAVSSQSLVGGSGSDWSSLSAGA